jgi:DNA topoisomerase-1
MADAKVEQIKAVFKAGEHTLEARGSKTLFDGFTAVYPLSMEEQNLPHIDQKSTLKIQSSKSIKHTTQPPKRYSEAQLIKSLEKEGIGRPSTYASILRNIVDRNYVKKENGTFHLTDIGLLVNDALQESFPEIINLKFTCGMEEQLDEIESGKDWKETIKSFYEILSGSMKTARKTASVIRSDKACAKCNSPMNIRHGTSGFFLGCSGYPTCKTTMPIPDSFSLLNFVDSYRENPVEVCLEPTGDSPECPQCTSFLILRKSKYGEFWGCSKYPECKYVQHKHKEIIACPECDDGKIIERKGKKQTFYGCKNYPDCKKTYSLKPTESTCPKCEDHLVQSKKKLVCSNKECEDYVATGPRFKKKKAASE